MTNPITNQRDTRIDVLRALALLTIFIDHVPGNMLDRLTYKNFGFSVCAVSDPLILRIPGLGGLCHLSVEADGEAIWQMVEKVLSVSARLLSLGAGTGGGQTR